MIIDRALNFFLLKRKILKENLRGLKRQRILLKTNYCSSKERV
jgi:hypothetical protein